MKEPLVLGIDLSLNHWALCQIDYKTGNVVSYAYMSDKKNMYKADSGNSTYLVPRDKKGGENLENFEERRKDFSINTLFKHITHEHRVDKYSDRYITIEGYAYASSTRSLCQLAEVSGIVKMMLYNSNIYVRIHDPLTVKLYATGRGHCLKKDVIAAAAVCGFNIHSSLIKHTKKKIKDTTVEEYDGIGTDLADSFFLARILRTELMLRAGIVTLENLPDNERSIFLRVTKAFPENILSRPFIHRETNVR